MMIRFIRRHALCVVLLVLGGGCGSRLSIAMPNPPSPVVSVPIAVFPLRNATGEAGLDWVSMGLQDSLTVDLWYVSALETRELPQMTEAVQAVCPDVTLACMAEQKIATWQAQATAHGYGGFLWGEYWRDGDAWVLRLGWYGLAGDTPLAEHTERGASLPNLLAASTVSLQAILAAQGIAVTDAERARMSTPKTTVAAAWEHNARGYWAQIRWILAADEAQRTARVATWERDLRAAVEADPDYAEAWNNLGWQRYALKAYGDAASPAPSPTNARFAFQQALRYKPDLIDARVGQGATLQALEKKTEALADYEKAVALNPSLAHHRKALLAAYQEAGQPEAGLAYLAALDAHLQRSGREDERTALYAWRIAYHTELKQWPQVLAAYQAWDDALARQTDEAHRYQRLELAQQLHDLGAQRHADGALGDAEAAYRQTLAILEAVRGTEHLDVRSLRALAETLRKQQRASEAEPLLQRADALWKAQHAALAAKQQQMGWEQLQGPARQWWQIFFTLNAKQPDTVLILLDELAQRQATLEDFFQAYMDSGAESVLEILQALDERRAEPALKEAGRLTEVGDALFQQRRYQEAEELYRRALAIREQVLGPDHPGVATSLVRLSALYQTTGRYAEAEPRHQRALAILEKVRGPDHPAVAFNLHYLSGFCAITGRYAKAEPLLRHALAIYEKTWGPDHPSVAAGLNDLANLYTSTGRYAEAEPLLRRALAIQEKALGPDHPAVAAGLNSLAVLYRATFYKAWGPDSPAMATSLSHLAVLYRTIVRYATKTGSLLRRALAIQKKALGPDHPAVAYSLSSLANWLLDTGRTAAAEPLYPRALRIAQLAGNPELLWQMHYGYAHLLHATQRPEAAIFFGKQAVNTLQNLRGNVAQMDQATQRAFKAKVQDPYKDLAAWLADAGRLPEAQRVLDLLKEEEYFEYVRRDAAAGAGQPLSFTAAETPPADQYRAASDTLTQLATERDVLRARTARTPAQEERLAQLDQQWDAAEQAFNRLLNEIHTALAATRRDKVEQVEEAEGLMSDLDELGEGTVAIYTLVGEQRLYLLLITPTLRRAYSVAVSEAEVNRAALAFRQALSNPRQDPRPAAQQFYQWLIAPLQADLQDSGAKTLLWSLDGSLRYLPMAALHDGHQYLAERYAQFIFTPASQTRLKDRPQTAWQGLGLGVTQAHADFPALPAVRAELTAIIRDGDQETGLLPGKLLFDEDFTLEALLRELQQRRPLVHISSHFRFTPGNDSQSYLLLGNGTLSLDRIQAERTLFRGVDLLTLSACETAVGDTPNATGAEVEGFAVLAQRKGAKAVLATLWSVADTSTAQFMQRFYALRQRKTLNKAEALRRTQIEWLQGAAPSPPSAETSPADGTPTKGFAPDSPSLGAPTNAPPFTPRPGTPYAHPYYWAPFILLGNGL